MVGRNQRGRMELPLELHVPFLGIVVAGFPTGVQNTEGAGLFKI